MAIYKNKVKKNALKAAGIILLFYVFIVYYFRIDYSFEFIFTIILISFLYVKLHSKKNIEDAYNQLEILVTLINNLDIKNKIPFTRGYAGSPDYLYQISKTISQEKPKLILEVGSGVSTLISSYTLKKNGFGKIISLDHSKEFSDKTKHEIKKHNLEDYAKVIYSPLKKQNNLRWYDISSLDKIESIDLLIIDGPPIKLGRNARYPAIPFLFDKLSDNAIILLDDARRKNERETIKLWKNEYNCFEFRYIENDKGLCVIKKIS